MKAGTIPSLNSLNKGGTQFDDIPGIVSFDASNLLSEDKQYQPHPKEVIRAAEISTKTELQGSDHVNLLVQARAILLRSHLAPLMSFTESGLDIVEIVRAGCAIGALQNNFVGIVTDQEHILRDIDEMDYAFAEPEMFYKHEKVRMVQDFQRAIQDLHIVELLIHSNQLCIDSVLLGLSQMSYEERVLRRRINAYMERKLLELLKRDNIKHIETYSLPLDLAGRVAECVKFDNKYGGGAFRKSGILFFGSGSAGETYYDAFTDDFVAAIPNFYKKHF